MHAEFSVIDSDFAVDDVCRQSRVDDRNGHRDVTVMQLPEYPPNMTLDELINLGEAIERVYEPGFLIREPDGTLRPIGNFEMHAHCCYLKHRDALDTSVQRWVDAFEVWVADGCPLPA